MSCMPTLLAFAHFSPPRSARWRNPNRFRRCVTDTTTTSSLRARLVPSYSSQLPEPPEKPPPCNHTITGRLPLPSAGREHVEVQAVLAHRLLPIERKHFGDRAVRILRCAVADLEAVAHAGPRGLRRRHEPVGARRGRAVRHTPELIDAVAHEAAQSAGGGLHGRRQRETAHVLGPCGCDDALRAETRGGQRAPTQKFPTINVRHGVLLEFSGEGGSPRVSVAPRILICQTPGVQPRVRKTRRLPITVRGDPPEHFCQRYANEPARRSSADPR